MPYPGAGKVVRFPPKMPRGMKWLGMDLFTNVTLFQFFLKK